MKTSPGGNVTAKRVMVCAGGSACITLQTVMPLRSAAMSTASPHASTGARAFTTSDVALGSARIS